MHSSNSEQKAWLRILVPRASLTAHTAFSRNDNPRPAPITAIAPSKYVSLRLGISSNDSYSYI